MERRFENWKRRMKTDKAYNIKWIGNVVTILGMILVGVFVLSLVFSGKMRVWTTLMKNSTDAAAAGDPKAIFIWTTTTFILCLTALMLIGSFFAILFVSFLFDHTALAIEFKQLKKQVSEMRILTDWYGGDRVQDVDDWEEPEAVQRWRKRVHMS